MDISLQGKIALVTGVRTDAACLDDVRGLFARIAENHGRFDILYANAGFYEFGRLGEVRVGGSLSRNEAARRSPQAPCCMSPLQAVDIPVAFHRHGHRIDYAPGMADAAGAQGGESGAAGQVGASDTAAWCAPMLRRTDCAGVSHSRPRAAQSAA